MNDELDSAYTSDAAHYNPYLDSDDEQNDHDSDDIAGGQISDSEADRDRVMINYTEHFHPGTGRTSDDIREDLEDDVEEFHMTHHSVLPESQQGDGESDEDSFDESMEVRLIEISYQGESAEL